jgi:hypothetical protein
VKIRVSFMLRWICENPRLVYILGIRANPRPVRA